MATLRVCPLRSRAVKRIKAEAAGKLVWTEQEIRAYRLAVNLAAMSTAKWRARNDQKKAKRLAETWDGVAPMAPKRKRKSYRIDWQY